MGLGLLLCCVGVGYAIGSSSEPSRSARVRVREESLRMPSRSRLRGRFMVSGSAGPVLAGGMRTGVASPIDSEWLYAPAPGESAGEIAEGVTGDDGRYQELLLVNPRLPKSGRPGVYRGSDAWGFGADELAGTVLAIPESWNPWIDETARPRGDLLPWPARGHARVGMLRGYSTPPEACPNPPYVLGCAWEQRSAGMPAPFDEMPPSFARTIAEAGRFA